MTGSFGMGYFIVIALVAVCGFFFRRWYAVSNERSQLVLWVIFFLLFPRLALVVYLILKVLRITLTFRTENRSHG